MYSEIYNAIQGIFMPIKSILLNSTYMAIPELTVELSAMLQLYYRYKPFEEMHRFKRVLKTPLFNPNRQAIVVVFDYDGLDVENDYNVSTTIVCGKFIYEGKVTAVVIVPLAVQQDLNKTEYLAKEMYHIVGHVMMTDRFGYPTLPQADYTYVPYTQTNIHAPDIIYIRWMMDTFLNVTLTKKQLKEVILNQLKTVGYNYQMKHVDLYMDLLEQTDIDHLLDYSYIASEHDTLLEIYASSIEEEKTDEQTISQD